MNELECVPEDSQPTEIYPTDFARCCCRLFLESVLDVRFELTARAKGAVFCLYYNCNCLVHRVKDYLGKPILISMNLDILRPHKLSACSCAL